MSAFSDFAGDWSEKVGIEDRHGMKSVSIVDSLVLVIALGLISAVLTKLMVRANVLAYPNHRSSHAYPVPSSGGIAIVITTYVGGSALFALGPVFQAAVEQLLALGVASLVVAIVGFLDDTGHVHSFRTKLAVQIVAGGLLLAFGVAIDDLTLPIIGHVHLGVWKYPVTLVWLVGLTNIVNFMDGLDGLAAGTVVVVATTFGLICAYHGARFSDALCFVVAAGSVGFFVFNFPKAKIFMGDVGSQFLGFSLAAIAVLAAKFEPSPTSLLVMPLLFFHFVFDTIFTFFRRLLAGENVTQAHKSHLYQLMNQLGYSHAQVSVLHFVMALSQAVGAAILTAEERVHPGFVFLVFIILECVYAASILRATRSRNRRQHI